MPSASPGCGMISCIFWGQMHPRKWLQIVRTRFKNIWKLAKNLFGHSQWLEFGSNLQHWAQHASKVDQKPNMGFSAPIRPWVPHSNLQRMLKHTSSNDRKSWVKHHLYIPVSLMWRCGVPPLPTKSTSKADAHGHASISEISTWTKCLWNLGDWSHHPLSARTSLHRMSKDEICIYKDRQVEPLLLRDIDRFVHWVPNERWQFDQVRRFLR